MNAKDLKIRLDNILLDYGIHVTNNYNLSNLDIYQLDKDIYDHYNKIIDSLTEFNELSGVVIYCTKDFMTLILVHNLDYRNKSNLYMCLGGIDPIRINNETQELIKLTKDESNESEISDEKTSNDLPKLPLIDDYLKLIDLISKDDFKVITGLNSDLSNSERIYYNEVLECDKGGRTFYLHTDKKIDKLTALKIESSINKISNYKWVIRATEVTTKNGEYTIAIQVYDKSNKLPESNSEINDQFLIFGLGKNKKFKSSDSIQYQLWLECNDSIICQGQVMTKLETGYRAISFSTKDTLKLDELIKDNCKLKIFKYNIKEVKNDKIIKGKQELLFEHNKVKIEPDESFVGEDYKILLKYIDNSYLDISADFDKLSNVESLTFNAVDSIKYLYYNIHRTLRIISYIKYNSGNDLIDIETKLNSYLNDLNIKYHIKFDDEYYNSYHYIIKLE